MKSLRACSSGAESQLCRPLARAGLLAFDQGRKIRAMDQRIKDATKLFKVRLERESESGTIRALVYLTPASETETGWASEPQQLTFSAAVDLVCELIKKQPQPRFAIELGRPSGGPWPIKEADEFRRALAEKGVQVEGIPFGLGPPRDKEPQDS